MLHLVYLHGFLSGPQAVKSTQLRQYAQDKADLSFDAPDFPDTPAEALQYLQSYFTFMYRFLSHEDSIGVFGSSMGGFFATLLQQRFGFRAVLLNPCVHPQEYFRDLIGPQENTVTGRRFELKESMLQDLLDYDGAIKLTPEQLSKLLICLQTGDEVLDYRKAQRFYQGARFIVQEGGCHGFDHFPALIPQAVDFLRGGK